MKMLAILPLAALAACTVLPSESGPGTPAPPSSETYRAIEQGMATLDGTSWKVASIDGIRAQFSIIAFAEGRMAGSACNRFSGTYRIEGDQLIPGPVMATKMACEGPRMTEESALLGALQGPLTIRERQNGRMVLVAENGRRIVLTPA